MEKKKFSEGIKKCLFYLLGMVCIGSNVMSISNMVYRLREMNKKTESEEDNDGNC